MKRPRVLVRNSAGWSAACLAILTGLITVANAAPDAAWSSYIGGSNSEDGNFNEYVGAGIVCDHDGNVIATGTTASAGWVSGGADASFGGSKDAFVVKLSPTGQHIWSTYLGGTGDDFGRSVATDPSGNIYVAGTFTDTAGRHALVAKLSSSGMIQWSKYFGTSATDGNGIAVDPFGYLWVVGGGGTDGFVMKLDSSSGNVLFTANLGGADTDSATCVATDKDGNVFVAGTTRSTSWISGGWDISYGLGGDGFVVKLAPSGEKRWSSYLGDLLWDEAMGIGVDPEGNPVIVGKTASTGWVSKGWRTTFSHGGYDGFVVKVAHDGRHLWSSYLGGSDFDEAHAVAVDSFGNAYVTGWSMSDTWVSGGWKTSASMFADAFLAKFNPLGQHMWSSFIVDTMIGVGGDGVAVAGADGVAITGFAYGSDLVDDDWARGGWDITYNGGTTDAFVMAIGGVATPGAPLLAAGPQNAEAIAGASVAFTVTATGVGNLTYQWQRRTFSASAWEDAPAGGVYSGQNSATLRVGSITEAMDGQRFRCVVTNSAGMIVTNAATLTVFPAAPPQITMQPVGGAIEAGARITLSVAATPAVAGQSLSYQWFRDGVLVQGAHDSSYTILSGQTFLAGTYSVVVSAGSQIVESTGATIVVTSPPISDARLMNLSTRALCQTGDNILIPGFVISGSGSKRVLMRAVGPTLGGFGVSGALGDPQMVLKRRVNGVWVDQNTNDNWGTNANMAEIVATAASVGAFPLDPLGADSALLLDLPAGEYTVVASGKLSSTGVAMVELYDADQGLPAGRLINISNRGYVGTGNDIMIPGFVVSNEGSRTFLIRSVGPTLAGFGLTGVLADPQLTVFKRDAQGQDHPILSNDNWGVDADAAQTASVGAQVGAFALATGSKDAAFVVTLPPGIYTVNASGVGGTTGTAIVEVYLVP